MRKENHADLHCHSGAIPSGCIVATLVMILVLFCTPPLKAQDTSRLNVSLITCGPGTEFIGASFGHNAIRIQDSARGTDEVYNYGTFDFDEPNFGLRFAQGTLAYSLSSYPFSSFIEEYEHYGRSVLEQQINFSAEQKLRLVALLEENVLPENRNYIYSSVYDNCATRVRDVLLKASDNSLTFGAAIPGNGRKTFRETINAHLGNDPWQRFGINILTGTNVDKVMTNDQAMYLPAYLSQATANGSLAEKKLVAATRELAPQLTNIPKQTLITAPFLILLCISLLTIILQLAPATQSAGLIIGKVLVFLSGVLGCLMLLMWFATDHKICENNLNLLWALPTNIIVPFLGKAISRYAIIAIAMILLSAIIHIAGFQTLPLSELWPVQLALIFTFGMIYRLERVRHLSNEQTDRNNIR